MAAHEAQKRSVEGFVVVPFVYTPRDHHRVLTPEAYRVAHARHVARMRTRAVVHASPARCVARIDGNSWLVDCECGAGNAADPRWGFALCFGCGAVHEDVVFPDGDTWPLIEALLVARAFAPARGWDPHESLVDLVAQNLSVGAEVSDAVIDAIAHAPARRAA